eukprot:1846729-Alexandrium_andersonii.AAC.1
MSASLVGSEMCIRDRPEAARSGSKVLKAGQSCPKLLEAARSCSKLLEVCLLYTSDAADDM